MLRTIKKYLKVHRMCVNVLGYMSWFVWWMWNSKLQICKWYLDGDLKRGKAGAARSEALYVLTKSFLLLFLVDRDAFIVSRRGGSSQVVSLSLSLSLARSLSEENSCRVREETLLFFPSCRFACDGQRSGFGSGCDVGCSLWARTQQRGGGGEGPGFFFFFFSPPLFWAARSAMTVTRVTPSWERQGRRPAA